MGAWGHASFDNDTAMDWAGEVLDAEEGMPEDDAEDRITKEMLIVGPLASTLDAEQGEDVDADLACDAVAAAELVAALFGRPSAQLLAAHAEGVSEGNTLGQLLAWTRTTKSELKNREDVGPLARDAVSRVLKSELAELWQDSEDRGAAWKAGMNDLQTRLS